MRSSSVRTLTYIRAMRRLKVFILSLAVISVAQGQDIAAFVDFFYRVHVFDHGKFSQIDPQRPKVLKLGGNKVVFRDVRDDLMIYQNGELKRLDRASGLEPTVTDHLVGYRVAGILKVYDDRLRMLTPNVQDFIIEDSLVAFKDEIRQHISVYYRGETIKLEDQLAGNAVVDWKAGDNVVAWISSFDRLFKVFYRGRIYQLSDLVTEMDFQCGLDMVAYQDAFDHTFKVFHQGTIYDLEDRMPHRYEVGKGVMAWLDLTNALKVFQGGKVSTVMDFAPAKWGVVDSLLVIEDQAFFNVFSRGRLQTVERVVPRSWQASWSTIAYVDVDGVLKVWRDGTTHNVVGPQLYQQFELDRNILIVRLNNRTARVWWRGQTYDY
jgi:hypothetical protein